MKKKGQGQEKFIEVMVIIVLLSIILIAAIYLMYGVAKEKAEKSSWKAACTTSVRTNAGQHFRGLDFSQNVKCPTLNITIEGRLNEEGQTRAKEILAESMRECWEVYGQGKLNLFSGDGIFCAPCKLIGFEDKSGEVRAFNKFLYEENAPGTNLKYLDYLAGYETGQAEDVLGQFNAVQLNALESEIMKADKTYVVMFVYAKGKNEIEKLQKHLTMQTTAGQVGTAISVGVGGAGVAVLLVASGPIGWTIGAVGVAAGVVSYVISYVLSPDNVPEWSSSIVLREYNKQEIVWPPGLCEILPVEQI